MLSYRPNGIDDVKAMEKRFRSVFHRLCFAIGQSREFVTFNQVRNRLVTLRGG
jgi:hypothetical protein